MHEKSMLDEIADLQFQLKEAGISEEGIARLTRFIRLDFKSNIGKKELKRWIEAGLIKDGKIVITKDDLNNLSTINFCLWDSVYNDDLQFIPPDQYSISEKAKRIIESGVPLSNLGKKEGT